MKKEFYDVVAMKPGESQYFKIAAESHVQHIPYSTELQGISASGMKKIRQMLSDGWLLQVCIGGRNISLENK